MTPTLANQAPDPQTAPPVRWGIIGPGGIARTFVRAAHGHTRSRVVAVGSRDRQRAESFASEFGIPRGHHGYERLVADPEVDVVYVASPHSEHEAHALLAINAGKHVLVEKSFTRNEAEAARVVQAARDANVFCMEAMWTRFLPHVLALRDVLASGRIGEVTSVLATHGQSFSTFPTTHRLHAPELAGGALLDLGVYPVSFAHHLLGMPDRIQALGSLTPTGVDGQIAIALGYGERVLASLHTTLWAHTGNSAVVAGTEGRVEVAGPFFFAPSAFTLSRDDGTAATFDHPVEGGFQYQIAEVARRITAGETESPVMPLAGTLEVMRIMDEIRRQVQVVYPGE